MRRSFDGLHTLVTDSMQLDELLSMVEKNGLNSGSDAP